MHAVEDEPDPKPPARKTRKQAWLVPLAPRQRFELVQMMSTGTLLKGREEMQRFERFKSAFGVDTIMQTAMNGDGRVSGKMANTPTVALHLLTVENAEFFLQVFIERLFMSPRQHNLLSPLIEQLEALVAGKEVPAAEAEEYDPATEEWAP